MIQSESNSIYKDLKKLRKKKYRSKTKTYLIESKKLVEEAIKSNAPILDIIVDENFDKDYGFKQIKLKDNLFKKLSELKNPEGIMARVEFNTQKQISSDKILILDNINDPGNIGTIIRSAEAFGFKDIILYNNCVDIYNQKSLRASMGSIFRVNIISYGLEEIMKLKEEYVILASVMDGLDYRKFNYKKCALVVGNEANGISNQLLNISDYKIKISMIGDNESLNAAIAASVLMHGLNL
ncbi:MAG: RNA methyltransferase [Tissierellia bacterium]|nr:RNA methyltransferase [Tissierellia bacterium]